MGHGAAKLQLSSRSPARHPSTPECTCSGIQKATPAMELGLPCRLEKSPTMSMCRYVEIDVLICNANIQHTYVRIDTHISMYKKSII